MDVKKMHILDFIENSNLYDDQYNYILKNNSTIEAIFYYAINLNIPEMHIDLGNNEYIDFKINGKEEFMADVINQNNEVVISYSMWTKNEFDDYINNTTPIVVEMEEEEEIINYDIEVPTVYLNADEKNKKHIIPRIIEEIYYTKQFTDEQLEVFEKCMYENINVNIFINPLLKTKQMNYLLKEYEKLSKTSSYDLNEYFSNFKKILLDNLQYKIEESEFMMLYNSYAKGTLQKDIQNEEYRAELKMNYYFSKSFNQNQPVLKTYNNLNFEFTSDIDDEQNEHNYIHLVDALGNREKIYDSSEAGDQNKDIFINNYIASRIQKDLSGTFDRLDAMVKAHYEDQEYTINILLNLGNQTLSISHSLADPTMTAIELNKIGIFDPFTNTDEENESISEIIASNGGIKDIQIQKREVEKENYVNKYVDLFVYEELKDRLLEEKIRFQKLDMCLKSGMYLQEMLINKKDLNKFNDVYQDFLLDKKTTLAHLASTRSDIIKCCEEGSFIKPIKDGMYLEFERCTAGDVAYPVINYCEQSKDGNIDRYNLYKLTFGNDGSISVKNSATIISKIYKDFNLLNLDQIINGSQLEGFAENQAPDEQQK